MTIYTIEQAAPGLRSTEVAVISSDEKFTTLAVTLPRELLTRNHHFIAALSDLASGEDVSPGVVPATEPLAKIPSSKKRLNFISMMASSFIIGLLIPGPSFTDFAGYATASDREPIKSISNELLTPVVPIGGELIVRAVSHRTRICPTTVHHSIIRELDQSVVNETSSPATSIEPTAEPVTIRVATQLPLLQPGFYAYRTTMLSSCEGHDYVIHKPVLVFEVKAAAP